MSFYLKDFDSALLELARSLRADLGSDVDLVRGGLLRSLIEAVAFQAADLSERQERSILEAIPEAVYAAFGFARLSAVPAQGTLLFSAPIPAGDVLYVPAGAEAISDDDQVFVTTVDAYIPPGQLSVQVPAVAQRGGAGGNVQAYSVIRLGTGLPGIQSVSNPAPFLRGQDQESAAAQQSRFVAHLFALDRSNKLGVTATVLVAKALEVQARNALVLDYNDDQRITPGSVQVHAYRRGGLGAPLKAAIVADVEQARSAGVYPLHTETIGVPVGVSIGVAGAAAAKPAVEAAIGDYFDSLGYGQKAEGQLREPDLHGHQVAPQHHGGQAIRPGCRRARRAHPAP